MITLSNGHSFEYMIASGALAFDGKGWPWERPLVALGLIKPELFTVVIKSLTRRAREGNLRWWKPWDCVRPIRGGAVNKVGLTNPGIEYWCEKIAPRIGLGSKNIMASIFGTRADLVEMAEMLNNWPQLKGIEVNVSCPNTGHAMDVAKEIIESVRAVTQVSRLPIIVKVSADQDYLAISKGLGMCAEAISLNSVPWSLVFPDRQSPLWRLEKRIGGGGGGVSGIPARRHNWDAANILATQGALPVIGSSVMEADDIFWLRKLGAKAVSFGTIHLPDYPVWQRPWTIFTNPCKPTRIVLREYAKQAPTWVQA